MKISTFIWIFYIILISCSSDNSDLEWFEIKESCSIDAYQDYLIKYPQTSHLPEIIDSLKVFWRKEIIETGRNDCHGNCLTLLINKNGQLLYEGKFVTEDELKKEIKYAILNPDNLPHLPDKKTISIEKLGNFMVSSALVDIGTDNQIGPQLFSDLILSVKSCFIEIREEYANKLFGKELDKLSTIDRKNIEKIVPIRIMFERYVLPPDVSPLPPDSIVIFDEDIELESEI